jgi:hypothetical protein
MHDDTVTEFGEHHAAPRALDDRGADNTLDAPHMLADCRLGQVQHGRGPVKSTTVRDRDDTAQRGDIQDLTHGANIL